MDSIHQARLAQSVEHQTLNRKVVGSSPTVDKEFFILYFVASDALLAGRLAPCKYNQAWRPSELYMCIEREKVDFKSREVNCLKECALALTTNVLFTTHDGRATKNSSIIWPVDNGLLDTFAGSYQYISLRSCHYCNLKRRIFSNQGFWFSCVI